VSRGVSRGVLGRVVVFLGTGDDTLTLSMPD
jgi:hypothetical protein